MFLFKGDLKIMTAIRKLIIIGGKGNGTQVASTVEDIIDAGGRWEIKGFLDDKYNPDEPLEFLDYPVLGKVTDAARFNQDDCYFYFSLFSVKKSARMVRYLKSLNVPDHKFATLVHPSAVVSKSARIGYGVCLMAQTFVGPEARLGNHILGYGQSYISRNTVLEDYAYLAAKACLGAESVLKKGAYLGLASTVIERIVIDAWAVVGAGANVLKNVAEGEIVVGNPAHVIGQVTDREESG